MLETGEQRTLAADADRRPDRLDLGRPTPRSLYFTADDEGLHSAYRVDLPDGRVTRLTAAGAVTRPLPDARTGRPSTRSSRRSRRRRGSSASTHGTADQVPRALANGIDERGIVAPGDRRAAHRARPRTARRSARWLVRPPVGLGASPARSWCSSTAGRWARGTAGTGAGTRTSSSTAGSRCSAGPGAVDRLRPAHARPRLGPVGRQRRTRTSWPRSTRRSPSAPTSTRARSRSWAARTAATWRTGSPATPTASGASSPTPSLWELRRLPRDHRPRAGVGARDGRSVRRPVAATCATRRASTSPRWRGEDPDARHPRREGPPRADLRGAARSGRTCAAWASRASSCTSRTRTTGSSSRRTRGSGTATVLAFLDEHLCRDPVRARRRCSDRAPRSAVSVSRAAASAAPP